MDAPEKKIFLHLDEDFSCQYKDIQFPTIQPPYFHSHNGYEILLLLGGELDFFMESGSGKLVRGDLVCVRPHAFHSARPLDPSRYDRIIINIRETAFPSLNSSRTDLSSCFFRVPPAMLNLTHLSGAEIERFTGLARDLQSALSSGEWGSDILSLSLLRLILVMLNQHVSAPSGASPGVMPAFMAELFSYIDAHIQDTLTIEQLAGHVHHNGVYLNRRFKQITGLTLNQYILAKKISRAQSCLQEGLTAGEACEQAGFHDYATFYRAFCREMGVSPKQYQQRLFGARAVTVPAGKSAEKPPLSPGIPDTGR